ncbi:MAG: nuclear transport factor 2 family protein [Ginsengibacter sp.]
MIDQKKISAVGVLFLIAASVFISCDLQNTTSRSSTEEIQNADIEFSEMSRQVGMKKAFLQYIDNEGVLLRPDHLPITGADAIDYLSLLNDTSYTLTWQPSRAQISKSQDLGYTYGIYTLTFPDTTFKGTYINVWKKESTGEWKLVLNSNNPGIK